ncbi:MAG: response regulator [Candidatus Aminicenantes bacterium]|nr:response regulator [Candidatus Aminicenantes bacterium]
MQVYSVLSDSGKKKKNYDGFPPPRDHGEKDIRIPPGFKILLIDDDLDFLNALEYRLKNKKIDVVAVGAGFDAIAVLEEDYFDLILLDLKMPGMNGAETFNQIKKIESKPFVIVMTAYSEDKQEEAVKKLKPFGFLKKPFGLIDLMPYIKKRIKEETNGN